MAGRQGGRQGRTMVRGDLAISPGVGEPGSRAGRVLKISYRVFLVPVIQARSPIRTNTATGVLAMALAVKRHDAGK